MGPIQLLFIMLLHMLPLFIMLLVMESPMLLTLLVFTVLLLLLSQLFMVPMQVLEDTSPTLLELFMLPNVKQRLILMLTTMHMDLGAMVLDTDSILMDMAMDTMDKQKNNSLTPRGMECLLQKPLSIVHSVNDPLFRSGDKIFIFHKSFLALKK